MESILTVDIGSSSMRAVHYDAQGQVLHKCQRRTVPSYLEDERVELDADGFVDALLSLLGESAGFMKQTGIEPAAVSVTSQRSSVVPLDSHGVPLAPFIMWHDKRTVPLCRELQAHEDRVYALTGLRISPVLSAVKMTWLRRHQPEIYDRTAKMVGIHDLAIYTLCGELVTDFSLASNTTLLNIHKRQWDGELLDIFSVKAEHLCDLVEPGSVCGRTTAKLQSITGMPAGVPVITAGGDQQCAALGLGVITQGSLKCTTGTGSYLIAHAERPVLDERKRFLCKIGAIPGSYNLEAGVLTSGTIYRWFLEQFYPPGEGVESINREVLSSPPGAGGVLMLPHFEGSGAPHWNPADCGIFYGMRLATRRADLARAVLEGIVMEMAENVALFSEKTGRVSRVCVSGGLTEFPAYNQLQADMYEAEVVVHRNRESTSLGAWLSAAVTCGIYSTYEEGLARIQPEGSETVYTPEPALSQLYLRPRRRREKLYRAIQNMKEEE
jgi:sugar (pentulose or hexulose) kinase